MESKLKELNCRFINEYKKENKVTDKTAKIIAKIYDIWQELPLEIKEECLNKYFSKELILSMYTNASIEDKVLLTNKITSLYADNSNEEKFMLQNMTVKRKVKGKRK